MSEAFYCIERPPGVAPHYYPHRRASWRRRGPGEPWVVNIDHAAQYSTREAAQAALEKENWHTDPSAGISVTEHAYVDGVTEQEILDHSGSLNAEQRRFLTETMTQHADLGLACYACDRLGLVTDALGLTKKHGVYRYLTPLGAAVASHLETCTATDVPLKEKP